MLIGPAPSDEGSVGEAPVAALLARGVCRALEQLGYASLLEFPLANGRRADILALGRGGDLAVIEIKSSVADFRADRKWTEYRDFADRFYFAVPNNFPTALIPESLYTTVSRKGMPNSLQISFLQLSSKNREILITFTSVRTPFASCSIQAG